MASKGRDASAHFLNFLTLVTARVTSEPNEGVVVICGVEILVWITHYSRRYSIMRPILRSLTALKDFLYIIWHRIHAPESINEH
jgi:hypothetical protein